MAKEKKLYSFPAIVVGMLFLINPYFGILDVLPDFIGWLMIYKGIARFASIDDRLYLASRKMISLIILSVCRLGSFLFVSPSDNSMIMTLSFAFGAIEVILVLLFVGDFFGGFEYLLQRHDGFEALSRLPDSKFLTTLFFVAKAVIGFLPEAFTLFEHEAHEDITNSQKLMELASYRPYARLLGAFLLMIFGIWWFYEIMRYFRTIFNDKVFIHSAEELYSSNIANTSEKDKMNKCLRRSFIITAVGFGFYLDFNIERISVFQDFIGTLLIMAGMLMISEFTGKKPNKIAIITAICQIVYSVCFRIFGSVDIIDIGEFPVINSVIMGISSALMGACSLYFIKEVLDSLGSLSLRLKSKWNPEYRSLTAFILYAFYIAMTSFGVTFPLAYPWLNTVRIFIIIAFIFCGISVYYNICGTVDDE